MVNPHLHLLSGLIVPQPDGFSRLCPCGNTGLRRGEQLAQQGGFPDAPAAGKDDMTLTAAAERIPDTAGGWPEYRRLDRLHIGSATPFPPG